MKILKGNLVSAPALGKLEIVEHGCLVLHDDGSIQSVEKAVPQNAVSSAVTRLLKKELSPPVAGLSTVKCSKVGTIL